MTEIEVGWVAGLMWGSFVLSVSLAVDLQLTLCLLRVPKTQQPQATSSPQMTDVAQLVNNEHMIDEKPQNAHHAQNSQKSHPPDNLFF